MATVLVAYGSWQVVRWPLGHAELISDLSFVPVSLGAVVAAWAASRRCRAHPRLRSAWRLVALASASYLAGDLTWMTYALAGSRPYPSAADGFYLLFYPLMLAGLLRFPSRRQSFAAALRLTLDASIVALSGAVVVVYLVLGPTLLESSSDPVQTAFSIAYPVGDMILLVGLASVVLRRCPYSIGALRLIAAGLMCFIAADLIFGYISLHSTYHPGDAVDTLWMGAMALFAVGAATQRPVPRHPQPQQQEIRAASWIPYAALAVAFGLLVLDERHQPLLPNLALLLASVTLTALVSIRQFMAQRDLAHAQRQLRYRSLHDALTDLPNRPQLMESAEQMLARAHRNGTKVAALYVDLDDFKQINDHFGHAAGDDVLRAVASRLSSVVRGTDTVGRLAGDEFIVLLEDLDRGDRAEQIAARITAVLREPVAVASSPGREIAVSASIGIALQPSGTIDDLLRDADYALYDVKRNGKRHWARFDQRVRPITAG